MPPRRSDYLHFERVATRWMDNDVYGHVNNAVYYSLFDSALNRFLIEQGGLDVHRSAAVAWIVHSECDFFSAVSYPDPVEVGLRVDRLGTSSVHYGVAVFSGAAEEACARGSMVHVFVDRATSRSVAIPPEMRAALGRIARPGGSGTREG